MPRPFFESPQLTLYQGDARDVLVDLGTDTADLVLTDPPYGMGYAGKAGGSVRGDGAGQGVRIFRQTMPELERVLRIDRHGYVFCHWESLPDFYDAVTSYWRPKNALVWNKGNRGPGDCAGNYAHDYELILFAHQGRRLLNGGRDLAVRGVSIVPYRRRLHPTEKPVELLRYLIEKSSEPGELVLDPFAGSGATLEAAHRAGRRAIGIEVDEGLCHKTAARLSALD